MGYSPRGSKESDTTERLHSHFLSLSLENSALSLWTVEYELTLRNKCVKIAWYDNTPT